MSTQREHEACKIINGLLDRFEEPMCYEQQEVVSQALAWLRNYAETLTAQVISQQNQNDTGGEVT